MWRSLSRDGVLRAALLAVPLMALPYLLPVLTPPALEDYGAYATNAGLLLLAIAVLLYRRSRVEAHAERRFWDLWAVGLGLWLLEDLHAWATDGRTGLDLKVAQDALIAGFYMCLVVAVRRRPDRSGAAAAAPTLPHALEAAATVIFIVGLLVYFSVIPFLYDRSLLATDVPSLVLYLLLDCVLVLNLAGAARSAVGSRWRTLYGWLLAAAALWLLTDALEAVMFVDLLPWRPAGDPSDLLWWMPFVPLLAAARLREHAFAPEPAPRVSLGRPSDDRAPLTPLGGDPLVAYAAAFPLMHFLLSTTGALDPVTRPARESFALGLLVVLGGLAIAYQKLLVAENRRLDAMRVRALETEHRAYHDALTTLPNRYLFLDRLEIALPRARRAGAGLAVLFLDLDRFKVVNDTLGHSTGDRLLRMVAERLVGQLRHGDTLARFGGDEFTLLVEGIHQAEDTAKIANKLRDGLREPFVIDGRELYVTASVGISLFPDDAQDGESLLKNSDIAMYRAKEQGRDTYQLYRAEMNARAEERLALESGLRRALPQGQFRVQYQPIVDVGTGRLVSCETLLRWEHPDKGLLLPGDFIDLAELTGVIVEVGPWILREACRQARAWQRDGLSLSIAVNLSTRQFLEPDLVLHVDAILAETGLDPAALELEITETLAMRNPEVTAANFRALRALGVRLSIDDFGTGYSSLSYLKRFPIDTLKIDRSFVRDIDTDSGDATIAETIIAMARSLGLRVVAEGVEREEQRRVLRDLGCDRAQGYLFQPPLWPEEMAESAQRLVLLGGT
jgi:diguanylate cyclase (GGDEF)-like protein